MSHRLLNKAGIRPLIQNRRLWKEQTEQMLPGHDGTSNIVYDEAGTLHCYDRTSQPMVRHQMAYIGYEPERETIKYRCPARHEGWTCPHDAVCNAGKSYGKTVRVDRTIDLRRFPPIPRATKKFERLYHGRTAVERVNARFKIFWGVDDGNITGARRFHAMIGTVMIVHAAFATLLAAAPRREGTLGKLRLGPLQKALRETPAAVLRACRSRRFGAFHAWPTRCCCRTRVRVRLPLRFRPISPPPAGGRSWPPSAHADSAFTSQTAPLRSQAAQRRSASACGGSLSTGALSNSQVRCGAWPRSGRALGAGTLAQGGGIGRFLQAAADESGQLLAVGHDHGGVLPEHGGHDVAEIPRVGAKADGRPVGRRLDHVLPAAIAQAPAHEGDLGGAPPGAQLADRIDQQDPRRPGSGRCRVQRRVRRCQATPAASSSRATASKRSGCRGTSTSRSCGQAGCNCRKTSSATASSGSWVLPASKHDVLGVEAGQRGQPPRGRVAAVGLRAVVFHRAGHVERLAAGRPGQRNRSA